jgi:hypothetical protein
VDQNSSASISMYWLLLETTGAHDGVQPADLAMGCFKIPPVIWSIRPPFKQKLLRARSNDQSPKSTQLSMHLSETSGMEVLAFTDDALQRS